MFLFISIVSAFKWVCQYSSSLSLRYVTVTMLFLCHAHCQTAICHHIKSKKRFAMLNKHDVDVNISYCACCLI